MAKNKKSVTEADERAVVCVPAASDGKENTEYNKKSDTSPAKKDKSSTSTAVVAAPKGKKKDNTGESASSANLPAKSGSHAVGPQTVPIRMMDEERRRLIGRIGALLLIVAVLAGAVLIFLFRPTEYTERTYSTAFLYLPDRDVTLIVSDGEIEGDENGYRGRLTYRTDNGKGDVSAVIIGETLYVIDGGDVVKIGDRVIDCVLSAEGDCVAWRNADMLLYYAEIDDPEGAKRVTECAPCPEYCLSPDGQELLYTFAGEDGAFNLGLLSMSGNEWLFDEYRNMKPVAVSDESRFLYYTDANGALYVLNSENGEKTPCGDQPRELIFNRDFSQLLMKNGNESRLFINGARFGIDGVHAAHSLELQVNRRVAVLPVLGGYQCLTESLLDQYYMYTTDTASVLVYLTEEDDRGNMAEVAHGAENLTVTDKYVFFTQTSVNPDPRTDLKCVEFGEVDPVPCYGDVSDYCTNVDGSRLTYITSKGLYSGKPEEMLEWLSDDIERDRGVSVTCEDTFYYFKLPGELWTSDNGEEPRKLADGVDWFFVDADVMYYGVGFADDGIGAVYANVRNSRKSDLLIDGVGRVD